MSTCVSTRSIRTSALSGPQHERRDAGERGEDEAGAQHRAANGPLPGLHDRRLRSTGLPAGSVIECDLQDLCEVKAAPLGVLVDLLAAGEAVSRSRTHRRSPCGRAAGSARSPDRLADLARLGDEAERAGHPAAARLEDLGVDAHLREHRLLALEIEERLVMAVTTCTIAFRSRRGEREVLGLLHEHLAEQHRALPEDGGVLALGSKLWSSSLKTDAQLGSRTTTGSSLVEVWLHPG